MARFCEVLPLWRHMEVFGNILSVYLVLGKKISLLWHFFMPLGKFSLLPVHVHCLKWNKASCPVTSCPSQVTSVTRKNRQMSIKVAQKWFHYENDRFSTLYKNCLRMWKIWANSLLPKALKSCPKSNKSPNLVTCLQDTFIHSERLFRLNCQNITFN